MLLQQSFTAGQQIDYMSEADFFRLLQASYPLTIIFYENNKEIAKADQVSGGYSEKFSRIFDKVTIISATAQTIQFVSRLGNVVTYDTPPNGNVTVTNVNGVFTNSNATVTNASAQLVAANTARRYLMIQNKDASGNIYVTCDGSTATTAKGIKIAAGQSMELQGFVPTGAIMAIGDVASNANISVMIG
jgi:hypothetical protein